MPKAKWIDKKTATTFALVHRAQNDPLIHDQDAPPMVFAEKPAIRRSVDDDDKYDRDDYDENNADEAFSSTSSAAAGTFAHRSKAARQRGDLEEEFGLAFKPNEGKAAQHGVFYDDTQYDYMQHMRDLGAGDGPVTWVEASAPQQEKRSAKGKQKLEDALRQMDIGGADAQSVGGSSMVSSARSLLPDEVLPSEFVKKRTYQDQQDVPDDIAGFQPDMDPRLREVLEALEDEAYVEEEEDIFAELTRDGYEVERDEWEHLGGQQMFEEGEAELDEDGWESDDTIRAASPPANAQRATLAMPQGDDARPPEDPQAQIPADPTGGAWLEEMKKFKADDKAAKLANAGREGDVAAASSAIESSALSSMASGRHKKRKGAKTSTTNYSMTSSALARTDQQTLLDARFDRIIEEEDALDEMADDEASRVDDMASLASGMTGLSKASKASKYSNMSGLSGVSGISTYSRATDSEAPQLERSDFNSIMDEFLGSHSTTGKAGRRVKRVGPQTGMEQLDEVRAGLGPARLKAKGAARAL
ncbi:hypothetical protein B0A50_01994 [Salinomyces thailandicus]|uniref:Low temperature viability protein n=1 Tax=Salinomyces thailandicus TaxID=706561 RepID=A0A4U0U998_9PEZI|nr:hypothetical protein B0A50_01994 [Salinomyces thailandica]